MSQHSKLQLVQNAAVHLLTWKQENNTPDGFSLASLLSLASAVRLSSLQKSLPLILSEEQKALPTHFSTCSIKAPKSLIYLPAQAYQHHQSSNYLDAMKTSFPYSHPLPQNPLKSRIPLSPVLSLNPL